MKIEKAIKENFKEVEKAYFIKEDGINFLRVETSLHKMEDIENISKNINTYIDSNYESEDQYFLDVLSKGTETSIEWNDLNKEIEKNIKVFISNTDEAFEGVLKEVLSDSIIIKYNAKGQFRNKNIAKINIEKITRSAVITKEKK